MFPPWKSVMCPSLSLGFWWTFGLRTEEYLSWTVPHKCASSLSSEPLSASSWLWWPMTAVWPYVTLCDPLHYPLVMTPKVCLQLAVGSWVSGIPVQIGHMCQIFSLSFCHSNQINHFFCDITPILKLACRNTLAYEFPVYVVVLLVAAVSFMLILASYSKIICTILRLPTARRVKAFSTCSSHLWVVLLFFGSATITYLRPKYSHSAGTDRLLSLFYTIVTPMINPMIYSLWNKDVITALSKLLLKI